MSAPGADQTGQPSIKIAPVLDQISVQINKAFLDVSAISGQNPFWGKLRIFSEIHSYLRGFDPV
jgi:hypothetical protein